jgi:hypothetical protein
MSSREHSLGQGVLAELQEGGVTVRACGVVVRGLDAEDRLPSLESQVFYLIPVQLGRGFLSIPHQEYY